MTVSFETDQQRPAPADIEKLSRKFGASWSLDVRETVALTPSVRRVTFGIGRHGLDALPGQNLVLVLPGGDDRSYARHYTIASLAEDQLTVDFVRHGAGPGARWAEQAAPGQQIAAYGPRGRVVPVIAEWQLFACDLSGLPAIAAILGALPVHIHGCAIIDVPGPEEVRELVRPDGITIQWRTTVSPARDACALLPVARPAAECRATLVGETGTVRAQRTHLLAAGFAANEIVGEGYWRHGRFGGHDHLDT